VQGAVPATDAVLQPDHDQSSSRDADDPARDRNHPQYGELVGPNPRVAVLAAPMEQQDNALRVGRGADEAQPPRYFSGHVVDAAGTV
jgi:hypothetical protein